MSILDANGSVACAECGRKARDERDKLLDGFHAMQQLYEDELKHALAENAKLRELLAKAGRLLPLADWTSVRYDEMAS